MIDRYDYQIAWISLVQTLGSDLVASFLDEMRLRHIYSVELKDLARRFIQEAERRNWPGDLVKVVPEGFLSAVSTGIGDETARALDVWARVACPGNDLESAFFRWDSVFQKLILHWDKSKGCTGIPLDSPHETHLRLMIREYESGYFAVDAEMDRVSEASCSEWDRERLHSASMLATYTNLRDVEFWSRFRALLSDAQADALLKWGAEVLDEEGFSHPDAVPELGQLAELSKSLELDSRIRGEQ